MKIRLLYFARLREAFGMPSEDVTLPEGVRDVGALAQWLYSSRDDRAGSSILEAPAYTIDVYA